MSSTYHVPDRTDSSDFVSGIKNGVITNEFGDHTRRKMNI